MRNVLVCWCVATGLVGAAPAFAQAGHGKTMVGWSCRMLNLTEAQSMDFRIHVPVRAEPSKVSPPVGYAMETVAIETSVPAVNGFVPAMFPTGRQVWIASDVLKPWHAAANPSARCVPVTKANGKPGFDYPQ
jgi:hypothetical protein